ncbi:MAG: SoxR reducing system RseC family protein [Nitrospirota bacterium]|jgi:sigma-E factor negative regulatory protein RseC
MEQEVGLVTGIEGVHALVTVEKKSVCEHCTAGTCILTDDGAVIEAFNKAQAKVGQRVRVALTPYTYVKGSIMVYGLPALALIIGAVLGKEVLSPYFSSMDSDGVSAIFGFLFFALSFVLVKLWSMRAQKSVQYKPVVEEILEN